MIAAFRGRRHAHPKEVEYIERVVQIAFDEGVEHGRNIAARAAKGEG